MAIDPLAGAHGVAKPTVCHQHQRKRTLDDTVDNVHSTEVKKPKTIAPSLLNLEAFPVPPRLNQPPSLNTYQAVEGCARGVHFRAVDYNSCATTIEAPQLSPKTLVAEPSVLAENDRTAEMQMGGWSSTNTQLRTPTMADASLTFHSTTPFSHWSESPDSVKSYQESLSFPQDVVSFPTMEPRSSCSSMTAHLGSLPHQTPFQHHLMISPPCQCSALNLCQSHTISYGPQSFVGCRRASSTTLPFCFQNHPVCYDPFMGPPHTAPLPVEPGAWTQTVHDLPLHSAPLLSQPNFHQHMSQGIQMTPSFISNGTEPPQPLNEVPSWAGVGDFLHQDEDFSILPAPTADNMSIDVAWDLIDVACQTQQGELDFDAIMRDAGDSMLD